MELIEKLEPVDFKNYLREYDNTICGNHPISVLLNVTRTHSADLICWIQLILSYLAHCPISSFQVAQEFEPKQWLQPQVHRLLAVEQIQEQARFVRELRQRLAGHRGQELVSQPASRSVRQWMVKPKPMRHLFFFMDILFDLESAENRKTHYWRSFLSIRQHMSQVNFKRIKSYLYCVWLCHMGPNLKVAQMEITTDRPRSFLRRHTRLDWDWVSTNRVSQLVGDT